MGWDGMGWDGMDWDVFLGINDLNDLDFPFRSLLSTR
jgi:hypothetical protein